MSDPIDPSQSTRALRPGGLQPPPPDAPGIRAPASASPRPEEAGSDYSDGPPPSVVPPGLPGAGQIAGREGILGAQELSPPERTPVEERDAYLEFSREVLRLGKRDLYDHRPPIIEAKRPSCLTSQPIPILLGLVFSRAKPNGRDAGIELRGQPPCELSVDGRSVSVEDVLQALRPVVGEISEKDAQGFLIYAAELLASVSGGKRSLPTTTVDQRAQMSLTELGRRLSAAYPSKDESWDFSTFSRAIVQRLSDPAMSAEDVEHIGTILRDAEGGRGLIAQMAFLVCDMAYGSYLAEVGFEGRVPHLDPLVPFVRDVFFRPEVVAGFREDRSRGNRLIEIDGLIKILAAIGSPAALAVLENELQFVKVKTDVPSVFRGILKSAVLQMPPDELFSGLRQVVDEAMTITKFANSNVEVLLETVLHLADVRFAGEVPPLLQNIIRDLIFEDRSFLRVRSWLLHPPLLAASHLQVAQLMALGGTTDQAKAFLHGPVYKKLLSGLRVLPEKTQFLSFVRQRFGTDFLSDDQLWSLVASVQEEVALIEEQGRRWDGPVLARERRKAQAAVEELARWNQDKPGVVNWD